MDDILQRLCVIMSLALLYILCCQLSVPSVNGIVALPEDVYEDVIRILFKVSPDSDHSYALLSDLVVVGCMSAGKP